MSRSRNSQASDTRLPAVPYADRRLPTVGTPAALPGTSVPAGDPPVWDTATLEHVVTMEVPYEGDVAADSGTTPLLYFVVDPTGYVTMNPLNGHFFVTVPTAAIYEFDVVLYNQYGTATETLTIDAT